MPARPDRAEKKKQRSKSRSHSESSSTSKASKPSKGPVKKPSAELPKKKDSGKDRDLQRKTAKAVERKGTAPEGSMPKVAHKPEKSTGAAKLPETTKQPSLGKGARLAERASDATKAGLVKPPKIKKVPKERRATAHPPPPLREYKFIGVPSFTGPKPVKYTIPPPPPVPPPPPPASIEERVALVQTRLAKQDEAFRSRYTENFDMSWIYHDSALEGVVYSFQELRTALDSSGTAVQDSTLQPVCEEIKRHKEAILFVRDFAKKRLPITLDVVKKIYLTLHPEEGDLKTLKYRKDIPQHRLYFHEYAAPDKIAYKVRQIVDWINDPETKRGRNALRIAARAHYDLVRVFPFTHDSGKVARLLMNLLLMRANYEPAIIHSTERQRYYEALKGSAAIILHMAQEAEENGLASIEKLLDEHETNTRSFVS
jgi:Fic family protein